LVLAALGVLRVPAARGATTLPVLDGPFRQDPAGFKEALDRAGTLLTGGQFDEALRLFRRANAMKGGKCPECLWGMVRAYNALGAEQDVIKTCDFYLQVVGADPKKQAAAHSMKGMAAWSVGHRTADPGKYAEAEARFRRALAIEPDMAVLHYNIGRILLARGQDQPGVEQMKIYLQKEPEGPYAAAARQMIEDPRRGRDNCAPEFSGTTSDGRYVNLKDLRGKVVVVDFWATWCGPCKEALPGLKRLVRKHAGDPFVLISISSDEDEEKWRAFIAEYAMTWPQLADRGIVAGAYNVNALPVYVVIDGEGIIRQRQVGYDPEQTDARIDAAVTRCLKELRRRLPVVITGSSRAWPSPARVPTSGAR
jgi:thiol-disulfide isomerase/thioredoxin